MEIYKYLTLARQARADGNSEDAKTYYNKIREEDPENGEAKFFYAFYSLYEGKNGEIPKRFSNVCQVVKSAIKMVKNSAAPIEEQHAIISEIANAFIPETWSLNRYMNGKNHESKVGDHYVTVFDMSDISLVNKTGMFAVRDFGDELEKLYNGDATVTAIVVTAWKEYVSLAQKWYSYAPKGEAEVYAEKIKKFDPSYEMPKKAGCIDFSPSKK